MIQNTAPLNRVEVMQVAERAYDKALAAEQTLKGYYDPQTGVPLDAGHDAVAAVIVGVIDDGFTALAAGAEPDDALGQMKRTLRGMANDLRAVSDAIDAEQQARKRA